MCIRDRLVIERSTPSNEDPHLLNHLMDLYMFAVVGGRERTAGEMERLLSDAGFAVRKRHRLNGGAVAIEAIQAS